MILWYLQNYNADCICCIASIRYYLHLWTCSRSVVHGEGLRNSENLSWKSP